MAELETNLHDWAQTKGHTSEGMAVGLQYIVANMCKDSSIDKLAYLAFAADVFEMA